MVLTVAVVVASALWWAAFRAKRGRHPNILLITLCSVRADHMSCYGYHRETTPTLDALAEESIVFDNAISPWPKTTPAFAAIITGKYPHSTGVMRLAQGRWLAVEHETVAEILQAEGYQTGAFIATPAVNLQTNMLQGCDTVKEVWRSGLRRDFEATKHALAWLRRRDERPFFAWVHYNNAHYPYRAFGTDPNMFVGDEFYDSSRQLLVHRGTTLALDIPKDHPCRQEILRPDIGGIHPWAVLEERPDEFAFYVARYDAGIHAADRMISQLLVAVRRIGILDNTVVAVVGDHGESLGEHNYFFEHGRFPYDDCMHVPMMIRPVDGKKPRRVQIPISTIAMAPSLLEMAGIETPEAMEASSLLPLVDGVEEAESVFSESGYQVDFMLSVRDRKWKLIHVPNEIDRLLMTGSEFELYNLEEDPAELRNLYDREDEVATRLRKALEQWSKPWIKRAYRIPDRSASQPDQATVDRLRSLGYLQ